MHSISTTTCLKYLETNLIKDMSDDYRKQIIDEHIDEETKWKIERYPMFMD